MKPAAPYRSLGLAAVALAAATPWAARAVAPLLVLDRAAVVSGELWRLVTGHLVHAGREHLLWDVLSLVGIGFAFEEYLRRRFWSVLGVSAIAVGAGLVLLEPRLTDYRGLSGVLNGLWAAGALLGARAERAAGHRSVSRLCSLALVLALCKILVEARFGPLFTDPARLGAPTARLSHALGFAGGALAAVLGREAGFKKPVSRCADPGGRRAGREDGPGPPVDCGRPRRAAGGRTTPGRRLRHPACSDAGPSGHRHDERRLARSSARSDNLPPSPIWWSADACARRVRKAAMQDVEDAHPSGEPEDPPPAGGGYPEVPIGSIDRVLRVSRPAPQPPALLPGRP